MIAANLLSLLVIGSMLVCLTIVARHMGRGPLVVSLPWILAAAFAVVGFLLSFEAVKVGAKSFLSVLLSSLGVGGVVSLFIVLIVLAVVGVKRDRPAPAEAF